MNANANDSSDAFLKKRYQSVLAMSTPIYIQDAMTLQNNTAKCLRCE